MKAALLVEPKKVEIREVPTPSPGKGEVLVKIKEAGICGTDYALYLGNLTSNFPIIPGHEAAGEIAALGPEVKGRSIGERVTIQPNFPCGKCPLCLNGRENICITKARLGIDIDGVFAQYVSVPQKYVWPLPEKLSFSVGTLTEPLSVALHGIGKCPPSSGERVLVYGAGVIGLLFVQLAILSKGWVAAFDIAEPRLAIAMELGAKKVFASTAELEKEADSFSLIYETSGIAEAFSHIVKLCAPGGRVLLTGLPEREFPVSTAQIVRKGLIIQGSMIYKDEFPAAINLLKRGKIKSALLISEAYPLERLPQAFEGFRTPTRIKTIIQIP
ncbi:MAG: alcohol dehydrogenase catalytic domain-containing protein [Thermodesulfobacteriota bacterium]|nr:alcohol dehydrogenase catalytic domain-containing protein [Thermodesulfobacteriota bacterium]